jgi:hypothetical protein
LITKSNKVGNPKLAIAGWEMATVETHCPRCDSPCVLVDETNQQYSCSSCDTSFRFVELIKKKTRVEIRSHNCPECGNWVKPGTEYVCSECGKTDLCSKCISQTAADKFICKECLTKEERACDVCGKEYAYRCAV